MLLVSRTALVLALLALAVPLSAQPRMHPHMGMVPASPSTETLPPYAPVLRGAGGTVTDCVSASA